MVVILRCWILEVVCYIALLGQQLIESLLHEIFLTSLHWGCLSRGTGVLLGRWGGRGSSPTSLLPYKKPFLVRNNTGP